MTTLYEFQRWPTPQEARITDPDLAYEWEERVAICVFDGGLSEQEARRIAWEQISDRANRLKEDMS
jgi:hypothetical protein